MYKVQSDFLVSLGHPNRCGKKLISVKALVIHWTANLANGADDIANARYFGRQYEKDNGRWEEINTDDPFRFGSAHYIVDQDSIQSTIPEDEIAYHVGAKTYTQFAKDNYTHNGECTPNSFSIGIEMCVNKGNSWAKTIELTAELASDIIIKYNLSMNQVVRHFDITGKICPRPFIDNPKAWSDFKALIYKKVIQKKVKSMFKDIEKHWAKDTINYYAEKGIVKGGTDGNFYPDKPITRAENLAILKRFEDYIIKLLK